MSKITCYIAMTLDGFIADEQGDVGFLDVINNTGDDYGYTDFYSSIDSVMMGSKTYEQILGFGDYPYSGKKTFIVTNREKELKAKVLAQKNSDELTSFHQGDIGRIIKQLKEESSYEHLWLVGGANLIKQMMEEDLLDELKVFIVPTLLGKGISLFNDVNSQLYFNLIDTKTYKKGVIELHYDLHGLE